MASTIVNTTTSPCNSHQQGQEEEQDPTPGTSTHMTLAHLLGGHWNPNHWNHSVAANGPTAFTSLQEILESTVETLAALEESCGDCDAADDCEHAT